MRAIGAHEDFDGGVDGDFNFSGIDGLGDSEQNGI
jgi:hypothetical protein